MENGSTGQVTKSAAEVYDQLMVPALFGEWASRVADAARLATGQHVLDVACGTGVLTREVKTRIGASGKAVGLDCNEGMLTVARDKDGGIEWQHGRAEQLPFEDDAFDAVVSQFGLMFFDDRAAGLREMWRVLRSGGHLAVAVWDRVENSPGYSAMLDLHRRLLGDDAAAGLSAPYCLGAVDLLAANFADAGIPDIAINTRDGLARYPSIETWVHTDIKGWTIADRVSDAEYENMLDTAERELKVFTDDNGKVRFGHGAHIVTAQKP